MEHAYCDESGKHSKAKAFIVSALVGTKRQWNNLSAEWSDALSYEGIKVFHANECENGRGEFGGMPLEKRERIQERLIQIMSRSGARAVSVAVPLNEYRRVENRLRTVQKYKPVYLFGFEAALVALFQLTGSQKVEFVFDQQREFKGRAKELYQLLKQYPGFRSASRMGSLGFASKVDVIPLQASDLLAYEAYRYATDGIVKPRWQMKLIHQGMRHKGIVFNRRLLERLAARMERQRGNG